jgi:hypothetical protein
MSSIWFSASTCQDPACGWKEPWSVELARVADNTKEHRATTGHVVLIEDRKKETIG